MSLPFCSKFVYGDDDTELIMLWPITPWDLSLRTVGGDIDADSGMRAAFLVRRDELLTFDLRIHESQWAEVQTFLDFAQTGAQIVFFPDQGQSFNVECYLDAPAVGDKYTTQPDQKYARILLLSITLVRPGGVAWSLPPYTSTIPGYTTHTFVDIFNGEFVITSGEGDLRVLLVAGGGGGGAADGSGVVCGGGGGGGMREITLSGAGPGHYLVVVGQGGEGGVGNHFIGAADDYGDPGTDSTFNGISVPGGGGGATFLPTEEDPTVGGSGGGVFSVTQHDPLSIIFNIDNGIAPYGFKGGDGVDDSTGASIFWFAGGGGGASGPGENYLTGKGGPGRISDITGEKIRYAGGGGGGRGNDGGPGGDGGGGQGGRPFDPDHPGGTGMPGTNGLGGGGGGGGGVVDAQGSDGGAGIVIVRYTNASGIVAVGGIKVVVNHD